jgi:pimeloyl-ACP methyl ester carboxylesterase
MSEPISRFYTSFGLRLHYLLWGDESKPPLVLVHGKGDHARSFEPLAQLLSRRFSVYALDLRGHGDSEWAKGGSYLIADYVVDLAELVQTLDRGPIVLVGHSLGGRIVPFYAAAFPDCVRSVISVEGFGGFLGPGSSSERLRRYAEEAGASQRRARRTYASLDEATRRMAEEHPDLAADVVENLARHAVRRDQEGRLVWKFDPLVTLQPFYDSGLEDSRDVWQAVQCPLLIIAGGIGWARMSAARKAVLTGLPNGRVEVVEGAGHWLHLSHTAEFMKLAESILAESAAPG